MAVIRKQFPKAANKGIKVNKDYNKFYISFRLDGKITQRTINYIEVKK